MRTLRFMVLIVILILPGSGCMKATTPSLSIQQDFFKSLKAANPEAEAALRCAQYHNLVGRFDLALQELGKVLAADPQNVKVLNAMGNCYDKLGNYARAQELYEKILAQDAINFTAHNNLGYSCYLSGDLSRAEQIYQAILAKNPEDVMARNNLGLLWCRQGKESAALSLWQKTEGEIAAREKISQVLAFLGKSEKPIAHITSPKDISPQLARGQADQTEKAPVHREAKLAIQKPAMIAADLPANTSSVPYQGQSTGYMVQKPQVKVEEVKMVVQPATFTQSMASETIAVKQSPAANPTAGENEKIMPGVNHPKGKEFVLDLKLPQDAIETSTPQPYRRPKQWPIHSKPKIVTCDPPPKESESFKKCLSQECIYQTQTAPARQDLVF